MTQDKIEKMIDNLDEQFEALQRHMRRNSYQTRRDYSKIFKRFYRFLAIEFRLEKLRNIGPKHLRKYVAYMKLKKLSEATIRKELSGIRYWFDGMDDRRYKWLPTNEELEITEKRPSPKVNRTWSPKEVEILCALAESLNKKYISVAVTVSYEIGARLAELLRLDTATVDRALKRGIIELKGKSGRTREVELTPKAAEALRELREDTACGQKLFVPDGEKTHIVKARIEGFIRRHRDKVVDPDWGRESELTFHGLRHSFAARKLDELIDAGVDEKKAKYIVSKLLGHNRLDIVDRYTCASSAANNKES